MMADALMFPLLVVGLLMAILPMLNRDTSLGRALPCFVTIFLLLRTMHWRYESTLPAPGFNLEVLWGYAFIAVETAVVAGAILGLVFLSRTLDRRSESQRNQAWLKSQHLKVDILIATYNEEEEILDRTIVGAISQDFPNFRIFVLDDGRRAWLRALCDRRGVGYITRSDNSNAKAGNINHALHYLREQGGLADFIAVLDADFVAQPKFLSHSLALFRQKEIGCVQSPQYFLNPDPLQHAFRAKSRWPDDQRYFFDVLMASRDAWGVAFCCGTSSVCRREALEAIDGFPTESVTEDMLLSIKLKAAGWRTAYLNERLSTGLAPEGLAEYITQRYRWCVGYMQIFRSEWGPFGSKLPTLVDRIAWFDTFVYWAFTGPMRLMIFLAPIIFGFFSIPILRAEMADVVAYYGASLLGTAIVLAWLSRGRCLPILSDANQSLMVFHGIGATVHGLLHRNGHQFKVTPKGGDRSNLVVQWKMMVLFVAILVLTLGAALYMVYWERRIEPGVTVWLFFSYYNAVVLLVAIITCIELPRSGNDAVQTEETVWLEQGGVELPYQLIELSSKGAVLRGDLRGHASPSAGEERLRMKFTDMGPLEVRVSEVRNHVFSVEIDADQRTRDKIIRRIYSDQYRASPENSRFIDVLVYVVMRVVGGREPVPVRRTPLPDQDRQLVQAWYQDFKTVRQSSSRESRTAGVYAPNFNVTDIGRNGGPANDQRPKSTANQHLGV